MTFPSEIQLLSSELRHEYLRPLMICKCMPCVTSKKISESVREKLERDIQNSDDIDCTDERQFLFTEKSLKNLSGACPVKDRRFNICYIGLNMYFGF